ncbi:MAG: hypothetical protein ACR2G0_11740 [Chthoniobacterales bacterium]
MLNSPNKKPTADLGLAHALLCLDLGINFFTHGLVRLPNLAGLLITARRRWGKPGSRFPL